MDAVLRAGFFNAGLLLDTPSGGPDLLSLVLDELSHGLMVVSLTGQVLHANQAARAGLARAAALSLGGTDLCDAASANGRLIHEALAKVSEGKRSLVTLAAGDDLVSVAIVPLRGEAGMPARAALMFARAAVHDSLMLGFFARAHGLTATEEYVLGILCQGYSTPEIAGQMKVAVSTVRTHVRSLCAKTRSCGVRELVNRVAVLPPVAPVVRQERVH